MSLEETAEYLLSEVPAHQLKKASISNTPYDATSWDGVIGIAPSKNAIRDKIETLSTDIDGKQSLTDEYLTLSGNITIDEVNYATYLGKTICVESGYTITINNVPNEFNATFIQTDSSGDVTFDTSSLNLRNRQSHTKIAGEHGVVGIKVNRDNDTVILFGDTKA